MKQGIPHNFLAMQAASACSHPVTYLRLYNTGEGVSSPSIHPALISESHKGKTYFDSHLVESHGHTIRIGGIPVVGIAIVVDIARIRRIARPHGRQPPVAPTKTFSEDNLYMNRLEIISPGHYPTYSN